MPIIQAVQMNPEELSAALECYLQMRQALICRNPECEKTARRFAALAPADIAMRRQMSASQCWDHVWRKPFYAGKNARVIDRQVEAIGTNGCLAKFETLAGAIDDTAHPWHVEKEGAHCYAKGQEVRAFCTKTGIYRALPYLTPAHVIRRVIRLATLFKDWEQDQDQATKGSGSFIDAMTGGNAEPSQAFPPSLFDALAGAVGKITAVHSLMDLGFRCVKPDIWMSRITTSCGWLPGYTAKDVEKNRRGAWDLLFERCAQVAAAANERFPSPNSLRELDCFISGYGMTFKPAGCPCAEAEHVAPSQTGDGR